ncbi:hypothetical protein B0H13DRAFT_2540012 [Mycena leptocephala]|nr:hypothetical protein B0H13DRAFT_2540012 [Mycena leptocephala]
MLLLVRVPSSVAMAGTVATGYWQQRRVINLALDFIAADAVVIDDHGCRVIVIVIVIVASPPGPPASLESSEEAWGAPGHDPSRSWFVSSLSILPPSIHSHCHQVFLPLAPTPHPTSLARARLDAPSGEGVATHTQERREMRIRSYSFVHSSFIDTYERAFPISPPPLSPPSFSVLLCLAALQPPSFSLAPLLLVGIDQSLILPITESVQATFVARAPAPSPSSAASGGGIVQLARACLRMQAQRSEEAGLSSTGDSPTGYLDALGVCACDPFLDAPPSRFSGARTYARGRFSFRMLPVQASHGQRRCYDLLFLFCLNVFKLQKLKPEASGFNISIFKPSSLQIPGPQVVKYQISQGFNHYVDILFYPSWPCLDLEHLWQVTITFVWAL